MSITPVETNRKPHSFLKIVTAATTASNIHELAFANSAQASIITIAGSGEIIIANNAACSLLGYSQKELISKNRSAIFNINEDSFKKMLKERTAEGQSIVLATAIKKSGELIPCEITSAIFMDEDNIEKAITTIADMSQSIKNQKEIDTKKEKLVADNIALAESKQKKVDLKKEKIVAANIALAKSEQKAIDNKKEKVVADNIVRAESKQKKVDIEKEKIVADNIALAKSEQRAIDTEKEKVVADNIILANTRQKSIDIKNEKIVAENIALAKSDQKAIDAKKDKIVADNIILAESKQKNIDIKSKKIVAENIALAKSEQKAIDVKKDKIVADNIFLAKSKQKDVDIKNEKKVAQNIALAKSDQKKIDVKKEKIVADNILLALEKANARLVNNKEWIKLIAKTSYDVMWDWNIISGEVYIGDSIEEIFGYKVQNNVLNFKEMTKNFLTGEDNTVEENLRKVLSSGSKSWNDSYTIKRRDGSVAAVNSRAHIVRDDKGKAIRLVGATQDISRLKELEKQLDKHIATEEEGTDILHLVGGLSNNGIWDWNILTNEFFLGEGFEELFGYSFDHTDHRSFDWAKHLHPDDRTTVKKGIQDALASSATKWEDTYRFTRADGSIANVFGRASIIRDADGKASRMIGAMQDLSRQQELEEKLEQEIATRGKLLSGYKENFKLIFNSSSDSLFDADLLTNEVTISDGYEKEFGYKITGNTMTTAEWLDHIHTDDKEAVLQDYRQTLDTEAMEWKYSYRFLRADQSVANVVSSSIILRNLDHKAYRMIGSIQDVNKQTILEDKLEKEIQLKEKQVAEATQEARQTERSDIGKELHDNVNQLLAVSKLYIDMAKKGGDSSNMYLSRSSEYTLTAIEEIRKITKGLTTDTIKDLGLCEAIDNIVRDTMEVNPVKIAVLLESFKEDSVNDKFKLNLFRIVQEQINNIIKHAKATEVRLSLVQTNNSIVLSIYDNGVGFDTGKKQKGIGVANIKSRAAEYDGTADFISQPGHGCVLTVTLPLADLSLPAVCAT